VTTTPASPKTTRAERAVSLSSYQAEYAEQARTRERICALEIEEGGLLLTTLRTAEEVRHVSSRCLYGSRLWRYPQCVVDLPTRCQRYWRMVQSVSVRVELLQAALRRSEQGLAGQRQRIEDLRRDGHRTTEAEDILLRFEMVYQALLAKLNVPRGEGVTG
jgi:hypothetical protein